MCRRRQSLPMTSFRATFRFKKITNSDRDLYDFLTNCVIAYFQSLLDAKLLTINSETLSPDSVVSLNLKSVEN